MQKNPAHQASNSRQQATRATQAQRQPLVSLTGVSARLGDTLILDDIHLQINPGEIITVIGPNGAGKSTLVRLALGLIKPAQGEVQRAPQAVVGYVPQHMVIDDFMPMTVFEFLRTAGRLPQSTIIESLSDVGAQAVLHSPLRKISGGELRRVLLARALLREPSLLILDEPAAGVDVNGQTELYALIEQIRDVRGCGILMVSHDLHLVMASTNRVICLNHHICCEGTPEDITQHPEYISLFGANAARALAVYSHHHDHEHSLHGDVRPK